MKSIYGVLPALIALVGSSAFASDSVGFDKKYFTIGSVQMVQESETRDVLSPELMDGPLALPGDPVSSDVSLNEVVNLGLQLWKIVENNKPVVNVTEAPRASALPKGADTWLQLAGWQNPSSKVFRVRFTNLYGITVIDFRYRVSYTFGGGLGGKGAYLANVSVVPADLVVAWGYKFNASVEVGDVVNAGTSLSPVAGMGLLVRWQIDTVLKHDRGTGQFFVRGDGGFKDLTDGSLN